MPQSLHLQSHPLWTIKRHVTTITGLRFTRPVLFLGEPLKLHGPNAEHVLANARDMGFGGALFAEIAS